VGNVTLVHTKTDYMLTVQQEGEEYTPNFWRKNLGKQHGIYLSFASTLKLLCHAYVVYLEILLLLNVLVDPLLYTFNGLIMAAETNTS